MSAEMQTEHVVREGAAGMRALSPAAVSAVVLFQDLAGFSTEAYRLSGRVLPPV